MSDSQRFERVRQLFQAALDRPSASRDASLLEACGGDDDLRREVSSLLAAHLDAGEFLEGAAFHRPAAPDSPLSFHSGDRLGHFEIIEPIGSGGMGEVYRACDTRLRRHVAVKLLPASLAADPQRLARFERESRLLAALNHPHIATIHSIEHLGGLRLLVLELVEGPTLAECLGQGPLPLESARSIASQLASALAAAHERGIVHRDLKPANVKLTSTGTVKLLDFGLAKAYLPAERPTHSLVRTRHGSILGTWEYMSPEQARGQPVDRRTDVWAFGCVLFELLTGRRAFGGDTPSDVIAAVLERAPDWSQLPGTVPADVRLLLARCLEKSPDRRWHSMEDVWHALEATPQPAVNVDAPQSATRRSRHTAAAALALLIVLGAALGSWGHASWLPRIREAAGGRLLESFAGGATPARQTFRSLAVLPFEYSSDQPDLDFISEGLSEGLIDRVSQLPDLKVTARSSSFRYKGRAANPRAIGRALGVEALIMGRMTRRGDDLLVRVELVDARAGTQIWSEQYSRPAADLQVLQDEIVRTIGDRLHLRLTTDQQAQLAGSATISQQAYLLYLDALYHYRRGTVEGLQKAIACAEEAVAIDDTFARAWSLIAQAYWSMSGNSVVDPAVALPRARAAALRALALDDTLAEAHLAIASLEQDEWNWTEAERRFLRAIELNPNLASAHAQYGRFLSVLGRSDQALEAVRRAQALDPLQSNWRAREGAILYLGRRYDDAVERLQQVASLEPQRPAPLYFLGMAYEAAGHHARSLAALEQALALEPTYTSARIALGYTLARSGRRNDARAVLDGLKSGPDYASPTELATLHLALDERDEALALLEEAYAARDLQLQYLSVIPHFDTVRSEARFQEVVRLVGLSQ